MRAVVLWWRRRWHHGGLRQWRRSEEVAGRQLLSRVRRFSEDRCSVLRHGGFCIVRWLGFWGALYHEYNRFFLDAVILNGATVFKLLPSEDETLAFGWDSFNLGNSGLKSLDRLDSVHINLIRLLGLEILDEDMHVNGAAQGPFAGQVFISR